MSNSKNSNLLKLQEIEVKKESDQPITQQDSLMQDHDGRIVL